MGVFARSAPRHRAMIMARPAEPAPARAAYLIAGVMFDNIAKALLSA